MNVRAMMLAGIASLTTAPAAAHPLAVSVSGVWSRPAIDTAVVYATIANAAPTPDRLDGATSPLAKHCGLHQTFELPMPSPAPGAPPMGGMPMPAGSLMSMRTVTAIPLPAHGTVRLAPGGYHLMLDMHRAIAAGMTFPLRLHFAHAGWLDTTVTVR